MPMSHARATAKISVLAGAAIFASSVLPVLAMVVYVGAPVIDGLFTFIFVGWIVEAGLLLVSLVEFVFGLVARRRLFCLDAALRALLVLAFMSRLGIAASACVPIVWSFIETFNPAYACRDATCEDAVVDLKKTGGAMLTPQCYIELVRLADPRGGRAAAVAVLRKSWPSFSKADTDAYAQEAALLSLGRGFWRADRCEDWNEPRSMRDLPSSSVARRPPSPLAGEGAGEAGG